MPKIPVRHPFPVNTGGLALSHSNLHWPNSASMQSTRFAADGADPEDQEINYLRAKVQALQTRVAQLEELAHRDCLLGIPNRRHFFRSLEVAIEECNRNRKASAILFVDLNRLKEINDTFGHNVGDDALIAVMRLMVKLVPEDGSVARLGGDEFGILLGNTDEQGACEMASSIFEAVNNSALFHGGSRVPLGVSVGKTMIQVGDNPKMVLERADKDMYRMKISVCAEGRISP